MRALVFVLLISIQFSLKAQLGGGATYQFLNVVSSPTIAALGGNVIALPKGDLEMGYFNPALLDSSNHNHFNLNYVDYFADINYGFAGYAWTFDSIGTFSFSTKYINYGEFLLADETGAIGGKFSVSESVYTLGYGNAYKTKFRYGANLKFAYSNFYQNTSYGVLLDLGGIYYDSEKELMVGLTVNNIGSQIKPYTEGNYEPVPFEVQLGASKRLKHAPFRFSLAIHNLQQPNFYFKSPNDLETTNLFGVESTESESDFSLSEAIFRHFSGGVELLLFEGFDLRFGYNHQRRSELLLREGSKRGMVGFNFGVGIKIKRFRMEYARSIYSLAGPTNHLSISTNFSEFMRRKDRGANE